MAVRTNWHDTIPKTLRMKPRRNMFSVEEMPGYKALPVSTSPPPYLLSPNSGKYEEEAMSQIDR